MVVQGQIPEIAAADLNDDGALDIVAAVDVDIFRSKLVTLLGDGEGGFASTHEAFLFSPITSVKLGDLNADGRLDAVATASYPADSVAVLLGKADGSFEEPVHYTWGLAAASWLADLDDDSDLDVVTLAGLPDEPFLMSFLNDGAGSLSDPITIPLPENGANWVAVGDVDGDDVDDAVVARGSANELVLLPGDGKGGFAAARRLVSAQLPTFVELADVDGDGRLDVIWLSEHVARVNVLRNQGLSTFDARAYPAGDSARHVNVGDVNGDCYPDLTISNFWSASLTVLENERLADEEERNSPPKVVPADTLSRREQA